MWRVEEQDVLELLDVFALFVLQLRLAVQCQRPSTGRRPALQLWRAGWCW